MHPPINLQTTAETNPKEIAALIDHTLLKPEAAQVDILRLCSEAKQLSFASVCLHPCWVSLAVDELAESDVRVCTVIGFPLGANDSQTKIAEAATALAHGARELDMVINIGLLRSYDYHGVYQEIKELADLAHASGAILKTILETSLLTEEEKITAARLAVEGEADFVKTSTGFSGGGATVEDVALLRRTVGPTIGVKASGGIRTLPAVLQMIEAGATRIGSSSGVAIMGELSSNPAQPTSSGSLPGFSSGTPGTY